MRSVQNAERSVKKQAPAWNFVSSNSRGGFIDAAWNVNYAVKGSFLLGFQESMPEVSAKLKEPNTKEWKFEEVMRSAEQAVVLVLVY